MTDVCTTQKAALILGISITSVQQLVETGAIRAWKTPGGHRRIPLAALHAYKIAQATNAEVSETRMPMPAKKKTSILIVEDSQMESDLYKNKISAWDLPATLTFCDNGYQALVEVARGGPDVLLADIKMEGIDGYEVIKTMLTYPELAGMQIAILSSMSAEDIEARGGLPAGVVFFPKPVNFDELRGYLRACCAQRGQSRFTR